MSATNGLNPPHLLVNVRGVVLRPFCVNGKRLEPGEQISLPRHDALSLQAVGKLRIAEHVSPGQRLVPEQ